MRAKKSAPQLAYSERQQIEKMLQEFPPVSGAKIARILERSPGTITDEIAKNGGRENYSAEKAQEAYLERHQEGIKKVKLSMAPFRQEDKSFKMRVEILEAKVKELENKLN